MWVTVSFFYQSIIKQEHVHNAERLNLYFTFYYTVGELIFIYTVDFYNAIKFCVVDHAF